MENQSISKKRNSSDAAKFTLPTDCSEMEKTSSPNSGLTASIENSSSGVKKIPPPYPEACLRSENLIKDNSLLALAKHAFHKLSKKSDEKWNPTTIQLQSWSILKNDLNLIAVGKTGSGKTLAYSIPMVDACMHVKKKLKSKRRIHGLVLLPTRELAIQVSKALKIVAKSANKLSGKKNIVALAIYGGINKEEQLSSLTEESYDTIPQFLVAATPMRLIDMIGIGADKTINIDMMVLFKTTQYFIVDEADRMATQSDMSDQVQTILDFLRTTSSMLHKNCLFSATLPKQAVKKCNDWIGMPRVTVKIDTVTVGGYAKLKDDSRLKEAMADKEGQEGEQANSSTSRHQGPLDMSTIPAHIVQTLHVCATHKKPKKLCHTIKKIRTDEQEGGNKRRKGLIIVFFARIKTLQYIHQLLLKEGIQCVPFHSQMMQKQREMQLNFFRSGKTPILLATDIAARGLHCNNVEYIINYDFPGSLDQYVHRCGRAGRNKISGDSGGGKKKLNACVYSFFHRELAPMAKDVVDLLTSCGAWIDPNLKALLDGNDNASLPKSRKRKQMKEQVEASKKVNLSPDNEEDEFSMLDSKRIVLKRAEHVKEDSDDE